MCSTLREMQNYYRKMMRERQERGGWCLWRTSQKQCIEHWKQWTMKFADATGKPQACSSEPRRHAGHPKHVKRALAGLSKDSHIKISVRQNESRSKCALAVHSLCSLLMAERGILLTQPSSSLQSTVRTKRDTVKGYFLAGGDMVWWPVSGLWFN